MTRLETWDNPELNLELYFCTEVLKLNSLHYGFWEQEEKLDLDSIRRAQKRYTETLIELIPEDVHTILDIGCGIGDNARALAAAGYQVTCISPDRIHANYFKDADPDSIQFINTGIESFESEQKYDLVLMSESQGYFAMDMGFSQSVRHLRPGGYLLVSGIFKKSAQSGFEGAHIEGNYIKCAQDFNLVKQKNIDITNNTIPTLQYAFDNYNNFFDPLSKTILHFIGERGRSKIHLLKKLFGREIRNFAEVRRYYEERFNPILFKDKMRYARILFQFQPNAFDKVIIAQKTDQPIVSIIVSAFNEELRLKDILTTLAAAENVNEVIVVNDGSTDQTAEVMHTFSGNDKVKAIHFAENQGKSSAMVTAALRAYGDLLVFFDADLINLSSKHTETLIQPLIQHQADMVIGDPQYKSALIKRLDPFRALSGERALWRDDFLPLAEKIRHSGYGVETLLNMAYKKNRKIIVFKKLDGLVHTIKLEKVSAVEAGARYIEEGSQIMNAVINQVYQ